LRRKIPSSVITPSVFEERFRSIRFYFIGVAARTGIFWKHCLLGKWTIAAMDWRNGELLCEVVRHGGSAAARVSVSAAVQRMETNVGRTLAERTTCHPRLTDART
jgi:hypothetical protein